jgi:predicted ATPase
MLTELQLQNFKCFQKSPTFTFSDINLLTGINGRGKSSLLHSILLVCQSARSSLALEKLIINDSLVSLGNFDDIKNSETPRSENIQFGFKLTASTNIEATLQFKENSDDSLVADQIYSEIKIDSETYSKEHELFFNAMSLFATELGKTHFVSADRLGPVKYVDKVNLPKFIHVGARGEHTINILANSFNLPNVHRTLYRGKDANSVEQQTVEWLSYILEGAKLDIKGKEKESSVLYMLLNNRNTSYNYKQANVGFGYSYVLPLIVTGLIAKVGDIVIIENPEAHLHPRAQSKFMEFFSLVASCGIQVFIESHSEHILNGLRVSTLDQSINISNRNVSILYFSENFEPETLTIDEKGRIEDWPDGFFDQQEIDLANIFKHSV